MRAPILPAAFFALLGPMAVAQVNPFVLYPQDPERQGLTCTSFVGRPDWNRAAEAHVSFRSDVLRGIGDANGTTRLFGVYHWLADEKLSTSETYSLVVRSTDALGQPSTGQAGELLRINGLSSPPSTSTARGTWIMYDGFGLQGGLWLLQGNGLWSVGVDLPANPQWPATDGHSLFRADLLNANTGATYGENHRAGAPNPTWALPATAAPFSTPWTYVLGPFVTTPNLHLGGIDPTSNRLGAPGASFGMNGSYPDVSGTPRSDGLAVRVTDNLAPAGFVFLAWGGGFGTPYYDSQYAPNLIGFCHLGAPGPNIRTVGLFQLQNGVREVTLRAPGSIPPALVGSTIVFQGVVLDPVLWLGNWTNAQAARF